MTIREFYTLVGGSYDDMSERFPSDALILRFLTMLPQDGSRSEEHTSELQSHA